MSIEQYTPVPHTPEDKAEASEIADKQKALDIQKEQQDKLDELKKSMQLTISKSDNPDKLVPYLAKNTPINTVLTVIIDNERITLDAKDDMGVDAQIDNVIAKIAEYGTATMTLDTLDPASGMEIKA